ncbi:MAG: molybdopterin biosynthesis protein, partial [Symbiobacteriaceae bacterium]|nr:molybdopterin biosynthesis protein [Symbiobacteriaceae bacterium]
DGLLRIAANSEGCLAGSEVSIELQRPLLEIENNLVVSGSHDTALDLISVWLQKLFPGEALSCSHVGSLTGLLTLGKGECHLAGTHLLDEEDGSYNGHALKRYLPGQEVALIHVAQRVQGLMVPKGNPGGIRGIRDLVGDGIRFVNRQRGAGTRLLLDMFLHKEGLSPQDIYGYDHEEFTHLAVAAAVAGGSADVGLGILAAALSFGLDFIPVADEDYELALWAEDLRLPQVQHLLAVLRDPLFQEELRQMGGYRLERSGEVRLV